MRLLPNLRRDGMRRLLALAQAHGFTAKDLQSRVGGVLVPDVLADAYEVAASVAPEAQGAALGAGCCASDFVGGIQGPTGPAGEDGDGRLLLGWVFDTPETGDNSKPWYLEQPSQTIGDVFVDLDEAPTDDVIFDVTYETGATGPASIFGAQPVISAGTYSETYPPTVTGLPADARLRSKIVSAPDAVAGGLSLVDTAEGDSGVASVSNVPIPQVAGVVNGDALVVVVACQSPSYSSVPFGWSPVAEIVSDPDTTHSRLMVFSAVVAPGIGATVPLTSGTPYAARTFAFRGAAGSPFEDIATYTPGNGSGDDATCLGAPLTASNTALMLYAWGARQGSGNQGFAAVDDIGLTDLINQETVRDGATNVRLDAGVLLGPSGTTPTLTTGPGDSGNANFFSWTAAALAVREAAPAGPGSNLVVQLQVKVP